MKKIRKKYTINRSKIIKTCKECGYRTLFILTNTHARPEFKRKDDFEKFLLDDRTELVIQRIKELTK